MAASLIKNRTVCVVDSNLTIGSKIKISGGGRCNITNKFIDCSHYDGDKQFIKTVLDRFGTSALLELLSAQNLIPVLQNRVAIGQYFCKHSSEVLEFFRQTTKSSKIMLDTKVTSVLFKNDQFEVTTSKGVLLARNIAVASGGLSYPLLGTSSVGYEIATQFGHTIVNTRPSLVGFTLQSEQFWMKELSGVSLPVRIKVADKVLDGDMLFAHRGISGPVILNASLYWERGKMSIDFLPNSSVKDALKEPNKQISTQLSLPKNFIKAFLSVHAIEDKQVRKLTKSEFALLEKLKEYEFAPAGNFGYTKAEVTKGGICTAEIDPATMQSKLQKGLYFLGECMDVTGELGGYNLHWAFASAFVCSESIN